MESHRWGGSTFMNSAVTSHVSIRPNFYEGAVWPLIATAPGVFIGAGVFADIGRVTLALERPARPKTLDCLRRTLLYLVLVFLVGWVAASYPPTESNYALAFQFQALSVVVSAIIFDALILFLKRRSDTNSTDNAGGET